MASATAKTTPTPVSSHPLFPAIVGLWFAALFGLGSLAIRPGLLEQAILAVQLDTLIPAVAPPLGVTARILLALVMAALGAAIGVRVGRGFARRDNAPAPEPRQCGATAETETVIATAIPGAFPGRRRALAIAEIDDLYSPHDEAPLPGGGMPNVLDINTLSPARSPLDLIPFAEPESVLAPREARQISPPACAVEPEIAAVGAADRQVFQRLATGVEQNGDDLSPPIAPGVAVTPFAEMSERLAFEPQPLPQVEPKPDPDQQVLPPRGSVFSPAVLAGDPETLGMVQLAERLALALQHRRAERASSAVPAAVEAAPGATESVSGESNAGALPVPPAVPAALRPVSFAEIDDDGLPDFEPLASLLPPRLSETAADRVPEEVFTENRQAAPREEVAAPKPAAPSFAGLSGEEDDDDDEDEEDDSYSSLLDLGLVSAPRQDFVRIEEAGSPADAVEPVVIFPGQIGRNAPFAGAASVAAAPAPPPTADGRPFDSPEGPGQGQPVTASGQVGQHDPAETERALRAALSNLQRISGAA